MTISETMCDIVQREPGIARAKLLNLMVDEWARSGSAWSTLCQLERWGVIIASVSYGWHNGSVRNGVERLWIDTAAPMPHTGPRAKEV